MPEVSENWRDLLAADDLAFVRGVRVGHLATLGARGFPSIVPVCFALLDDPLPTIVSVLDEKPKRVPDADLGRVRHIRRQPQVGLTIDHYEEDWSQLIYVQIRGIARLIMPGDAIHAVAIDALRAKYPQYRVMNLAERGVIAIAELRVRTWRAAS